MPCLTINGSDFMRDLIAELPTFSQILVTFLVIIFVSLQFFFPHFGYHFYTEIFVKSGDLLFTSFFFTHSDDSLFLNTNLDLKNF